MEDNARPAKRPRLGQASLLDIEANTSPVNWNPSPVQNCIRSTQGSTLSHEHQCSTLSIPSLGDEGSSCLRNENYEAAIEVIPSPECARAPDDKYVEAPALVCFGSITSFSVSKVNPMSSPASLQIDDATGLRRRGDDTTCGKLAPRDMKLLGLFKKEGIQFDLLWIPSSKAATGRSGTIWLTLYGEKTLARDLGDTLQSVDVYLQEPIYAERDVTYWNPHKFQNIEGLRAISLKHCARDSHPEVERAEVVNVLKHFTSEDDLPETRGCVASLRTPLKSHQMRGLTFMIRREHGWLLNMNEGDVWSVALDQAGNVIYRNNIGNSEQYEAPTPFYGGIVADDMGLGKTLSMISLIIHDKSVHMDGRPSTRTTTLVVMPPSLLLNWEAEVREHTSPGHLSWYLYYGRDRSKGASPFSNFDIVFTTYPTLANEWRAKGQKTNLFRHHWHRVILDEAQFIKDGTTATAQATCDLIADRRWVVTATPIQNRLSELFSLFRFLRLYPYDDYRSLTWGAKKPETALDRLKLLLGFIMLRRLNNILDLPERRDIAMPLEMNSPDMTKYNLAKRATVQFLDDMISTEPAGNGYLNAITKINALRMVCNLGCSMDAKDATPSEFTSEAKANHGGLGVRDESFGDCESSTCMICGQLISSSPTPSSEHDSAGTQPWEPNQLEDSMSLSRCRSCFSDAIGTLGSSCDSLLESQKRSRLPSDNITPQEGLNSNRAFSTKIEALVSDLKTQTQATKSIVFSFWTSTLDLASTALTQAGFTCLQVDGKTAPKQRGGILQHFSELDKPAVLLMSLSCGAVGLNLTAASRVYLMEPQWNPAIEEQALARVYRLGQTQPVVTVRFYIKESIEEYVREVQMGKKELVGMLLSKDRAKGQSKVKELRNVLT